MTHRDWLTLGIKLIGVYFAILGVTALAITGSTLAIDVLQNVFRVDGVIYTENRMFNLVAMLQPVAYVVCAFLLLRRTEWCLNIAGAPGDEG